MADDFAGTSATNGTLAVGGYARGDIETPGDTDWFSISLVGGATYRLFLQGTQQISGDAGATLPDPFLRVLDAGGVQLAFNDNGSGRNPFFDFTAPVTGTYFLEAGAAFGSGTGTYALSAKPFLPLAEFADYLVNGWFAYNAQTHPNSDPRHWAKSALSVNVSALTADEQAVARTVVQLYQDITNLTFSFTTAAADITFEHLAGAHIMQVGDWSYDAQGHSTRATIQNSDDWGAATTPSALMNGYLHEFGHVLGLGHSGPYNGGSPVYGINTATANDSLQQSIMTYFGWPTTDLHNHVISPQMADIYALQSLYGANPATRLGDTTYGFHASDGTIFNFSVTGLQIAFTIYDSGGTDTFDGSGDFHAQRIDLSPGAWSSVGGYAGNIGISLTTVIENAVGGSGADTLIGNTANNQLYGGDGNDSLTGVNGSNYLRGDAGDDVVLGGAGFDDINGNMGNDTEYGGLGDDWVVGGKDNDLIAGEAGDDIVYGNLGNDTASGGDGVDWVRGGQGDDTLGGGAGDDWMSGDLGSDTIVGGAGADVFHTWGAAGLDRVLDFSAAEGDRVQLDPGTAYTVGQVGSDTVISMTGGGQMVLVNVTMAALPAGWLFGA